MAKRKKDRTHYVFHVTELVSPYINFNLSVVATTTAEASDFVLADSYARGAYPRIERPERSSKVLKRLADHFGAKSHVLCSSSPVPGVISVDVGVRHGIRHVRKINFLRGRKVKLTDQMRADLEKLREQVVIYKTVNALGHIQ